MEMTETLPDTPDTPDLPEPQRITAQDALDQVLSLRVTTYDQSLLLRRLLTLENMIRTEIHFTDPLPALSPETELITEQPYQEVYEQYLLAQVDLMDMELEQYNMDMQIFTSTYGEYAARYRRDHLPKAGKQVSGYD